MPFNLASGDVLEHKTFCWSDQQIGINVHHWVVQTLTPVVTSQDALGGLGTAFGSTYRTLMPTTARFSGATLQRIRPLPLTQADFSVIGAGPGVDGGDVLPKEICGIISLYTGLAGRKNRGRRYIPFPTETFNDRGEPNITYINFLTILKDQLSLPIGIAAGGGGSATLFPVIWQRATASWVLITNGIARNKWAQQHRRGDYGRLNPDPFA